MRPPRRVTAADGRLAAEICAVPATTSMLTVVRPEIPIASRTGFGNTTRPTSSISAVVFIGDSLPIGNGLASPR